MKLFTLMQTAYNNFDATVSKYLSKVFDSIGLNSSHSQIYTIIFDGIKGVMQNAMFYIEDALTEQNIFTATRKQSVYSLAKISGYEPFYGSAATGTLIAKIIRGNALESDSNKIFIYNNSILINKQTSIRYIVELNSNDYVIDITKPLLSHEFKIVEGLKKQNYFTALGTNFETFSVNVGRSLFNKLNIEVFVNGEKFTEQASMYDMTENKNEYVISIGYDGGFEIMFGDGIYGNKLKEGDSIVVEWIAHNGSRGNILSTSLTNFKFETSGKDIYGNDVDLNKYVLLNMSNCISGGTDSDSIDTIRNMIGYNSRSLILATEENFYLWLKRFSFIGKVNCWSHENTMQIIIAALSNKILDIKTYNEYFELNTNDLYLSNDQEQQIINTLSLSNRTFAGITVKFKTPKIWKYAAICICSLKDNYNKESIKEALRETLGNYFINLKDNVEIIYRSDIIKTVLNEHEELLSFDIQFITEKNEYAFEHGYYEVENIEYKNGMLLPNNQRVYFSNSFTAGLDDYGNILVESKLEIPILHGGFKYYGDKESKNPSFIKIDTLQFIFL